MDEDPRARKYDVDDPPLSQQISSMHTGFWDVFGGCLTIILFVGLSIILGWYFKSIDAVPTMLLGIITGIFILILALFLIVGIVNSIRFIQDWLNR